MAGVIEANLQSTLLFIKLKFVELHSHPLLTMPGKLGNAMKLGYWDMRGVSIMIVISFLINMSNPMISLLSP